jgi:hypothetical protein
MALVIGAIFLIIGFFSEDDPDLAFRFLKAGGYGVVGMVIWFVGSYLFATGPTGFDPFAPYGANGWSIE